MTKTVELNLIKITATWIGFSSSVRRADNTYDDIVTRGERVVLDTLSTEWRNFNSVMVRAEGNRFSMRVSHLDFNKHLADVRYEFIEETE